MIKSMHLVNIQSWKDETIEFAEDLVNVVSARSERGKTVLFKVFYQMVFPTYYKFGSRNDLIRRGCSFGEVTLKLSNFTEILFHCEHKEQWFKMKRPCDSDWVVYYQSNCPQEIINELGLIVDYELKYILNIYIKDNQYPFINTTKTWNAVLFNQVFKNEKLDCTIERLSSDLKELNELEKRVKLSLDFKMNENNSLQYKDIDAIIASKDDIDKINELYNVVDEINKVTVKYEKNLETYEKLKDKVFDVVDINEIRNLIVTLSKIAKVTNDMEHNLLVIENTPDNTEVSNLIDSIKKLFIKVSELLKRSSWLEQHFIEYSKVNEKYNKLTEISDTCNEIRNNISLIDKIRTKTVGIEKLLVKYAEIQGAISNTNKELEEVKSKIKICPTCKRPL